MKRKSLALLAAVAVLLVVNGVRAEENEVKPTGKFGEAAKQLRERTQEERKKLLEQNKEDREELRENVKEELEDLKDENEERRETMKTETKKLLEGKTPEERLTLMPSIQAERKALNETNKVNRQATVSAQREAKKTLTDSIKVKMDAFRTEARAQWTTLWNSFFGKK